MVASALKSLEREIERIATRPRAPVVPDVVSTGLTRLDALLPGGGLPRGRIVEWRGPRSSGKTAVLRASLKRLRDSGESVALIDGSGTLYAADWFRLVPGDGEFWIVRPPTDSEASWCADLLLRSGAFGAVAVRAPGVGSRASSVRLQRLAEESASVFVVLGEVAVASLRLGFRPGRIEPVRDVAFGPRLPPVRPVWIRVGKGGEVEVPVLCPVPPAGDRARTIVRDRKGPL